MSDMLSGSEIEAQQVELLPARTVMSSWHPPSIVGFGKGGNGGAGGAGGAGGIGLNVLNINLGGDQTNSAGDGGAGGAGAAGGAGTGNSG